VEPRNRGSASPLEAARCSMTSSTPGAVAKSAVWEGSAWSRWWSRSQSPPKHALNRSPPPVLGAHRRAGPSVAAWAPERRVSRRPTESEREPAGRPLGRSHPTRLQPPPLAPRATSQEPHPCLLLSPCAGADGRRTTGPRRASDGRVARRRGGGVVAAAPDTRVPVGERAGDDLAHLAPSLQRSSSCIA
jgi:hypothetical protein